MANTPSSGSPISALPFELLTSVLSSLLPRDYLRFCSTCHAFQDSSELRCAQEYWQTRTLGSFPYPILKNLKLQHSRHWLGLNRRLHEQVYVYGWGDNEYDCLGPPRLSPMGQKHLYHGPAMDSIGPNRNTRTYMVQDYASWPTLVRGFPKDEIIVDLQCGADSSAILTAAGDVYVNGAMEMAHRGVGDKLHFGFGQIGFGDSDDEDNPPSGFPLSHYKIREFSLIYERLLALTESGSLWMWRSPNEAGVELKLSFSNHGVEQGSQFRRVFAGQNTGSALVECLGIVVWRWDDLPDHGLSEQMDVGEYWIVPGTGGSHDQAGASESVIKWITPRDNFIVYLTLSNQVFGTRISTHQEGYEQRFEILPRGGCCNTAVDLHGRITSFTIKYDDDTILTLDIPDLESLAHANKEYEGNPQPLTAPTAVKLPAYQQKDILNIAHGTDHLHALHATGKITSYGYDGRNGASHGLGNSIHTTVSMQSTSAGQARAVHGSLVSPIGRSVHFEPEKEAWLDHISKGGADPDEAQERIKTALAHVDTASEVNDWIEHRLTSWEDDAFASACNNYHNDAEYTTPFEDDGLPSFLPLLVSAGAWHSTALVLVNSRKAARVRRALLRESSEPFVRTIQADSIPTARMQDQDEPIYDASLWKWEGETFPRLRLRDGRVMEGRVAVEEWTAPEREIVELVDLEVPGVV